ncbi:TlpA family protein disulfide reductase [Robertkochia flava]|uniref:TlpA family protein disulfide reductase n=1 Tax=Robertkochia flava TaxID=3447986 RepID=UPI001CCCA028|nr:TlpA disulfide reductase family protein [Robertkochia marina]
MKKSTFVLRSLATAGLALTMASCNAQADKAGRSDNKVVINASIEGLEEEYLTYFEKGEQYPNGLRADTLWVNDGKFTFTDTTAQFKRYRFAVPQVFKYTDSTKRGYYPTPVMWIDIIGYPGAEIRVEGSLEDFVNAYPEDGGENDIYGALNKEIYPLLNRSVNLRLKANTREEYEKTMVETKAIQEKVDSLKEHYIRKHPASAAMAFTLLQAFTRKEFDKEKSKELFATLDAEALRDVAFYKELEDRIKAAEGAVAGNKAPAIKTNYTYSKQPFDLEDMRGNYVLIDFWGTWCGPCVGEMPKIKAYTEKYAGKNFKVLGIDSGDTEERWRTFIEEKGYHWTHIRTVKNENDILIPYNVRAFPTKYLLDPEGTIIHVSTGSSEEMFEKIDAIFSGES